MQRMRSAKEDLAIRQATYDRLGVSSPVANELELAVAASPSRPVGKGALTNVVTLGVSPKSSRPITSESHSIEQMYLHERELDAETRCIYSQVPIRGVTRWKPSGKRHVSSATMDFLVFTNTFITLVECKAESWLRKHVDDGDEDWREDGDSFIHKPGQEWALARGLEHRVWSPPPLHGQYGSNLITLVSSLHGNHDSEFIRQSDLLLDKLPSHGVYPVSLAISLCESASIRNLIFLMAKEKLFGAIRSQSLSDPDLVIGRDRDAVRSADSLGMDALTAISRDPQVNDKLLLCSSKAMTHAIARYRRIEAMENGEEPWTTHFYKLRQKIGSALNPATLSQLVPQFAKSGNRVPRLSELQLSLARKQIAEWEKGIFAKKRHAYIAYEAACNEAGVEPASDTTFYGMIKAVDPAKLALRSGGMRAYQQEAPRSDPLDRTIPTALARHTIHIDSTPLDMRSLLEATGGSGRQFVERGLIYVARDVHGEPLARAFVLGEPRRHALGILWRDYVSRNGELPSVVHQDRGSEQESKWHRNFSRGRFRLRIQPTAGSRYNQPAEDLGNHVNSDVCHWLQGNTLPDRYGRAVDGRFKSIRTARWIFPQIVRSLDAYLFETFPSLHKADGVSFADDRDHRLEDFGSGGTPCEIDDDFLIATSIPLDRFSASEKEGVRTTSGFYLNREMQTRLRTKSPEAVLADCVNPSILRVRIAKEWFTARRSDIVLTMRLSQEEMIAKYTTEPMFAAAHKIHRKEIQKHLHNMHRRTAEEHVNPNASVPDSAPSHSESTSDHFPDFDPGDLEHYEEIR